MARIMDSWLCCRSWNFCGWENKGEECGSRLNVGKAGIDMESAVSRSGLYNLNENSS